MRFTLQIVDAEVREKSTESLPNSSSVNPPAQSAQSCDQAEFAEQQLMLAFWIVFTVPLDVELWQRWRGGDCSDSSMGQIHRAAVQSPGASPPVPRPVVMPPVRPCA